MGHRFVGNYYLYFLPWKGRYLVVLKLCYLPQKLRCLLLQKCDIVDIQLVHGVRFTISCKPMTVHP